MYRGGARDVKVAMKSDPLTAAGKSEMAQFKKNNKGEKKVNIPMAIRG